MKYWMCINYVEDGCQENYEEVWPCLGALFVAKNDEEPPCTHPEDKWIEISKNQYEKCMEDPEFIVKYDGVHCIGKCTECKEYICKKKICNIDDKKIKDPNKFRNCCVYINDISD